MTLDTGDSRKPAASTTAPADSPDLAGTAGPLDAGTIQKLRELDPGGTQDVLGRVFRAYDQSLSRQLAEMRQALAQGEQERLMRLAHTLKSSSASVGALVLSRHCAELERAARSTQALPEAAQVEALIHEGQAVLAAVRAMLPS